MRSPNTFTGELLLALPAIGDPRFDHSVIVMVSHDDDGAMGLAINRPSSVTLSHLLESAGVDGVVSPDPWVLIGGPVEPQRGFVIHSPEWSGDGTLDVGGQFAVSGSVDVLRAIAEGRGPRQWQVAMGYAGWGPGQLEAEIAGDAWHITSLDQRTLFGLEPECRWRETMMRDGIDPARLVAHGGRA